MTKALIMMCVYNGEKYLGTQIDSILSQSDPDWELIIQDDGSIDKTEEIIREYETKDDRIKYRRNTEQKHGAFVNFHLLSNYCKTLAPYAYYLYADQDDEWYTDKLKDMKRFLDENDDGRPLLCYADMALMDGEGNTIADSIDKLWTISRKNKYSVFFVHKVFGCNLIMNKELFFAVPSLDVTDTHIEVLSHDNLYTKYAAVLGKIAFFEKATMRYRRSGNNVTAAQKYTVDIRRIADRILHLEKLAEAHTIVYSQSIITVNMLRKSSLTSEQKDFITDVEQIIRKGGLYAVKRLKDKQVIWGGKVENISHNIVIGLNLYKKYLNKGKYYE